MKWSMPLFLHKALPREEAGSGIVVRATHLRAALHVFPCLVCISSR
jgi:hypothetical protein